MNRTEFTVRMLCLPDSDSTFELRGKLTDWNGRVTQKPYLISRAFAKCERGGPHWKRTGDDISEHLLRPVRVPDYGWENSIPVFQRGLFYCFGYSQDHSSRIQQELLFIGIHPDDIVLFREKLDAAIQNNSVVRHTFCVFKDVRQEYRWIHLDGLMKRQGNGAQYLYAVFNDVSEQVRLEKELAEANS